MRYIISFYYNYVIILNNRTIKTPINIFITLFKKGLDVYDSWRLLNRFSTFRVPRKSGRG